MIDLNKNTLQKFIVKFKPGKVKDGLQENKPYFLQVEAATAFPDENRRINIYTDNMKMYQYYYPRDGKKFDEEFEILCSEKQQGGKRKTRSKRKNHVKSNRR